MSNNIIGIIAANNIRYSPYIFFYTNILDECGVSYELIYPDRNGIEEEWVGIVHKVQWNNKRHRLFEYEIYAKKVKRIIKKRKYTKLIVLTSVIATYMGNWLSKHYKNMIKFALSFYIFYRKVADKKIIKNAKNMLTNEF